MELQDLGTAEESSPTAGLGHREVSRRRQSHARQALCYSAPVKRNMAGRRDWMSAEQEPTKQTGVISVEGASLGYRIEGRGIPCLVPGGSSNCARLFSPELREWFQLHFVDTRGFVPTIEPY